MFNNPQNEEAEHTSLEVRLIVSARSVMICAWESSKAAPEGFRIFNAVLPSIIVLATERAGILCRMGGDFRFGRSTGERR